MFASVNWSTVTDDGRPVIALNVHQCGKVACCASSAMACSALVVIELGPGPVKGLSCDVRVGLCGRGFL